MNHRILPNWLEAFLEWTLPRSEAPESLLIWSGLFTIAAVTKRDVCFPASLLGSYDIYPSLYVIFVGPPGAVRKSTTAGYTEGLLRCLNAAVGQQSTHRVHLGPTAGSHSKLLELMSESPDGSMAIISSEFGNLVMATPEAMYDVLTDLFDNRPEYDYSTRLHGTELIVEPSLNLLGCTTPGWISENSGYMIHGGFASRVIFIFESSARQRRLYYDDVEWEDIQKMEEALVKDLIHISKLKGEFTHETSDLKDEMESWYVSHADSDHSRHSEGFHSRKHVHAHKLAMLLSLCERDDLVITEVHFKSALGLLEDVEQKLPEALSVVGRNPHSANLYRILHFIQRNGPVTKGQLLEHFWHDMRQEEVSENLDALLITEKIERLGDASEKARYKLKG